MNVLLSIKLPAVGLFLWCEIMQLARIRHMSTILFSLVLKQLLAEIHSLRLGNFVERNGSWVELQTLDCVNPVSNPVLQC